MKKLKIILLFSILIIIRPDIKSKFNLNTTTLKGTISSITKEDNYYKLILDCGEKVIVYINDCKYDVGDIVIVNGKILELKNNSNFNLFNYKKYCKSKRIFYSFKAINIKKIGINKNIIYYFKRKIVNLIDNNSYLYVFILADQDKIDSSIKDVFKFNGISHLLAISSTHINFLIFILMLIFNKFSFFKLIKKVILLIFLFIYSLIIDSISVNRVVIFLFLKFICDIFDIKISTFKLFIFMFILFLICNPYLIYNTGFLFSFFISGSIILFKKMKSKFMISIICFMSSLIFSIQSYHRINLLSPVYNLFYIPFVTFILYPSALITLVFKPFNKIFSLELYVFEKINILLKNYFSFSNISLCHLSLFGIIFYILFILLIFLFFKKKKYYIIFIIFPIFYIHHNIRSIFPSTSVTMLDVGQGDCSLITYNGSSILIDTGGKYNSNSLTSKVIIPYLDSVGINHIDTLVLTHGDFDHMGEAINLVNNFKVEKVIFNCGEYNNLEKELIKVLDKKKIKYYSCIKELNIDKNKLHFLQTKDYDNENDNSNVIITELNGYKFMFMGDASITTEREIIENYNLPDIDVLKVGHHGSKTSSGEYFINEINPKYSIISVGKNNRYGHPNKEVLENLKNSKIYRTDEDGSIMFKIKNNKLKIETCSP